MCSGNVWPRPSSGAQEIRTALRGEGVVEKLSEGVTNAGMAWARVCLSRRGELATCRWRLDAIALVEMAQRPWHEGRVEMQAAAYGVWYLDH